MAKMVILGALAAFGALCAAWLLTAALLPGSADEWLVYCWRSSSAGRSFIARWRLQWELGLLRSQLIVIDLGLTEEDRAFLTRWGRNVEIWETGNGTGT